MGKSGVPVIRAASAVSGLLIVAALLAQGSASAQSDEIQVYQGGLADPGRFNLTLHNNYTPHGIKTPAFPGAVISDQSLNGVPEWAYGVTPWFEAGLYLPLYSFARTGTNTRFLINGAKLRALFAVPHADDRTFFYGANFEFSGNAKHWDTSRFTSEIRPVIGWHLRPVDIVLNPIFDTSYDGLRNLDFAPSTRVAYVVNDGWTLAAEEYGDFGAIGGFAPRKLQSHQLFAVVDHSTHTLDIEAGAGFGMTPASDHLTLKLILSRDLN